ncbi:protein ENHANCED DISEASE RESISTANCE 4 isoform X3 [Solanum pennellii]|uniref:Protein ENHANCED DISEASE RESISTANCE 4 isoform X3 n=1 Tax=Solanum pennellii TaxID=28526 RepID=A0ABM1FVZ9_SOLPN|nr:protein ENHANCED DISEASE RESISTANCE 4 isoform X3 [Solanum pennellii]
MSEQAKVRLVRCPKCENLLPELTDYSVYQCGGCGAVLRVTAKNKNGELNKFVEKSEEETMEKPENFDLSDKKPMNMADGSGYDVKSNGSSSSRDRRRALRDAPETYRANLRNVADNWANEDDRVMYKTNIDEQRLENMANEFDPFDSQNGKEIETRGIGRVTPYRSSRQRSEAEVLSRSRRADREGMRFSSSIHSEEGSLRYSSGSIYDSDKRLYRKDVDGFNQEEQIQENKAKEFELSDSRTGKEIESRRTGRVPDWRSEAEVLPRARRVDPEGMRYASSVNSEEGPSGYWSSSNYDNDKRLYGKDVDDLSQVDCPVDERAELLRKFDELKEQLSRFGDVSELPNERVPLERRMAHHEGYGNPVDRFPESSTRILNGALAQNHVSGERPPYLNHYNAPSPFMNSHDMAGGGFYPPRDRIQGYGGPRRSQLLGGDPYEAPAPFQLQPSHSRFSGRSMDNEIPPTDPYRPYLPQANPHHPSCNCFHCCNLNQVHRRGPPAAFGEKRYSDISQNPMFHRHQNRGAFAVGGFARRLPPRGQPSGHLCLPVAGGAPFLTCFNCFQLLQIPKEVFHGGKRQKMKCGSCSAVMVIAVSDNKLTVSIDERIDKSTKKMGHQQRVMLNEGNRYSNGHTNRPSMTFSSEDYDTSKYDFHAMDQELGSLSTGRGSSLKSAEMRSLCSTSSRSSREEDNLNKFAATMEKSDSELPMKGKESPPPAGSPLQEYFDHSNKFHAANRLDHGNRSTRSDAEKLMQKKTTSEQNSTKDLAAATEMDIPSNEYGNTSSSLGSGVYSKEGDQLKATKASFFSGIIKNSFKEFSRSDSSDGEKANITVNGHLIPDRLIKRAEKRAGPIQPGHYWYDFRAGFWGVIGGHCLGIIPPFIEEFNYPMPENCAGGGTGVFVNGRELNPKDLKLLASRGLPADRDGSYILEISGRVLDEDSGEELESLGKLAPTVEKAKRGFGMRPPKVEA